MPPTDPAASESRSFPLRLLWLALAAVTIIVAAIWLFLPHTVPGPVPEATQIRSMEATFYDRRKGSDVTFQVPAAHWRSILASLLPAKADEDPAKWEVLGELQINLVGGGSFQISLYSLDEELGAFSSGPTWEDRTYYRGGSTARLERALEDAFKASDKK